MSGGKGGTQTTENRLPEAIERASAENLAMANEIGRIGFVPYQGPTVAGLSSPQQASMANTNAAASAFGLAQAAPLAPPMAAQQSQMTPPAPNAPVPTQQSPATSTLGDKGGALSAATAGMSPSDQVVANFMMSPFLNRNAAPQTPSSTAPHQFTPASQQLTGEMGAGYSPYSMYLQAINAIPSGQLGAIQGYTIDPQAGGLPSRPVPSVNISPRSRGKK